MPDVTRRDPDDVAAALTRWLARRSGTEPGPQVYDVQAPEGNGFSNETILCKTRRADGEERRLVVRVAPTKHTLFMDAQFSTQYRIMRTLADSGSAVPLPPLGLYEEDPTYLGVPFFTMEHVPGLVPADNLPYTLGGWVVEATAEQQERMWWSGIDALAAVHSTDWRALDLGWLGDPERGAPGLDQQLSYYRDFLDWATKGVEVPIIESVWRWLVDHRPPEEGDVVVSWGDSRIGNIIWDDFRAVAVLDWEMASLAQPEMDLGWWLYFDRQFSEGLGVPRPAGFGAHQETIDRHSERMGRPMRDVFFYEIFAGFRFAVIMYRLSDLIFGGDGLAGDDPPPDLATNNLATQFLATLLALDPPA